MLSADWRGRAAARAPGRRAPTWPARGWLERGRGLWDGLWFGAAALLAAAVALLLLDFALFDLPGLGRRLPFGQRGGSPSDKLLLAARYPDTQVLYLGDSRVHYGIDPAVVSESCQCGPGYNAGTPALEPGLTRVMARQVLQTLSPKLVVIGLSQWELSDGATIHAEDAARELVPPWQLGQFGLSLDPAELPRESVDAVWRLYRYRTELRQALELWTSGEQIDDPRRGFRAYGEKRRVREKDLDRREDQWFDRFSVEGRRAEALRGLLADLQRRDVAVMIVAPPLYPKFHARVRREVAAYRGAVERIAAEQGATFVDLSEARQANVTSDHFKDVVHLNEQGATRLSRELGKILRSRYGEGLRALQ